MRARLTSSGARFGPGGTGVRLYLRDQSTQRNPRADVDQSEHGLEHGAGDIVKIDIDPLGARRAQLTPEIIVPMVDSRVESQLVHDIVALLFRARDAYHATSLQSRDLPGN